MATYDIPALQNQLNVNSNIITNGASNGSTGVGWGITQTGSSDPEVFVFNAIVIFLYIFSVVAALTFIWAGVKYMTAGGDAEKAESAKKIIIGSIVGMLIILGSLIFFRYTVSVLSIPTATVQDATTRMNQSNK